MDDEMCAADESAAAGVAATATLSIEQVLATWRTRAQAGTLDTHVMHAFFRQRAAQFLECNSAEDSAHCVFDEDAAKKCVVVDLLLQYIFGEQNVEAALNKLQQEGNTTSVCGKIFKSGDPTYFCRECGVDSTCVLCITCFRKSAHRFHKYKLSTSGGGGCCDCGDDEAWKKDAFCEEHMAASASEGNNQQQAAATDSDLLTADVLSRCREVFTSILSFSMCYLHIEPTASLKCLDGPIEGNNQFCTILYNDESHTFDQVIQTLTKHAKCRHKNAVDMVAAIDREGRAVVKVGTFQECADLKTAIESQSARGAVAGNTRSNQPLRSSVLHAQSVAAQQLSIVLLNWMQDFIQHHFLLRQLFSVLLEDTTTEYSLGSILEKDFKLWKTARTTWHRLLIAGMLREYDSKLNLAREFSRRYTSVVSEFLRDDHDYGFSVISVTVQLFTVPSIAHHLIANEGTLEKFFGLFYNAMTPYIRDEVLHFSKTMNATAVFKRSSYILFDLRYLLSVTPESWNSQLRSGFIDGCRVLLTILSAMQGMECMTRQTGQHMDYEPEWECAFNLHVKLSCIITQIIEWAGSDLEAQLILCQMTLRHLAANKFILPKATVKTCRYGSHAAECLYYDVSSEPVSVHLPLTRFFAGLYLNLARIRLTYKDVLPPGIDFKLTPRDIIEPVLCTAVLNAQTNANMWRRNGYSVVHQLFFYRNVRCRSEMYDRDIICLQIGASLIESNEFLLHVLNKFKLVRWMNPEFEPNISELGYTEEDISHQVDLIDEFLELLIVIIGERSVPGISAATESDRYRKEIIHLLSIKSVSHSELARYIPEANTEVVLDSIINELATFQRPRGADTKGVYVLKEQYHDEFNLFFYHYVKEERSAAELRQIERRRAKGEFACCPPPKLAVLEEPFEPLAKILDCDVFLAIILAVIERAKNQNSKHFHEFHLQKILHLIGYAMQEEMSQNYNLKFFEKAKKLQILKKLEELKSIENLSAYRDMLLWTIKKWVEYEKQDTPADAAAQTESTSALVPAAKHENTTKQARALLAAERRAVLLAQMSKAQNLFMTSNQDYFGDKDTKAGETSAVMDWEAEDEDTASNRVTCCLGPKRPAAKLNQSVQHNCILCHDTKLDEENSLFVCLAFVQKSRVLCDKNTTPSEIHTSSCGHVMHYKCWLNYFNSEEARDLRRPHRNRTPFHNQQSAEYICSYCRGLSNAVLPVVLSLPCIVQATAPIDATDGNGSLPLDEFIELLKVTDEALNGEGSNPAEEPFNLPTAEELLQKAKISQTYKEFESVMQLISGAATSLDWKACLNNYVNAGSIALSADTITLQPRFARRNTVWKSISYTIESMELFWRVNNKALSTEPSVRDRTCLSNLIRSSAVSVASLTKDEVAQNLLPKARALLKTVLYNKGDEPSLLQWNCFAMLIDFLYTVPNSMLVNTPGQVFLPNGSLMEYHLVQIFYVANIVKAIMLYDHSTAEGAMDIEACAGAGAAATATTDDTQIVQKLPEQIKESIINFYRKYNLPANQRSELEIESLREDGLKNGMSEDDIRRLPTIIIDCDDKVIAALLKYVKGQMRQFLRCCCIFFHFVTDIEMPTELAYADADEHEFMCQYLNLNSQIESFFDLESAYAPLMQMFASQAVVQAPKLTQDSLVPCVREPPTLISLPLDYGDLINNISTFTCPNHQRDEMKTPTLCLLCGAILCGQSFCCQFELGTHTVGACTAHADKCGAEIGMFLRIRECQLVLIGLGKGCYIDAPYLDEYGETDQNLRRGNPLNFCEAAYRKIYMKWLNHQLHEEISRQNETANYSYTQWHLM